MSEAALQPRWLDINAASLYVNMKVFSFRRAVSDGRLPQPSRHLGPRTLRWDRIEIDDRISGAKRRDGMEDAVNAVVAQIKAKGAARREAQEKRRLSR